MRTHTVILLLAVLSASLVFSSCSSKDEFSLEEIEGFDTDSAREVLAKTVSKPWEGQEYVPGIPGGTMYTSITEDPKTFNLLVAARDQSSMDILGAMHPYLTAYDYIKRSFIPVLATFEVLVDEPSNTLSVEYTLREGLVWSYYDSDLTIPVTSDDVVFWFNEIEGDPVFQHSGYTSQFVSMPDGSEKRITCRKIDDRRFAFDFPRIIADPVLATNMNFGPRFLYEKAKTEGGEKAVMDLFSVSTDPKQIPSVGMWFLVEYTPGQRLVYRANRSYWEKDVNGKPYPYLDEKIIQIVPDDNTQFLLFKQGKLDYVPIRAEDIDEMTRAENPDYTIFRTEGALGPFFWTFNQNPKYKETPQYEWFTKKEFRQAMSSLLNRERLIAQVYRGFAEPKYDFFPEPNPFYNPEIVLKYRYDLKKALALLQKIGFARDEAGVMRDDKGRPVEFDLTISSDQTVLLDTASVISDECAKIGIAVRIRPTDFQKIVEQLTVTFDWQTLIIGVGRFIFPTGGSNVWPTDGNLHMWYPFQSEPATDWEARIDDLYDEGLYTLEKERAKKIWDEFQTILLEECPFIYLVRVQSFIAVRNRFDFTNLYFDNIGDLDFNTIWLKK